MPRPRKQHPAPLPNSHSGSEEEFMGPNSQKKKKGSEEKTFICPQPCGKVYGSVAAWHTHFRKKHKDIDDNAQQIREEFYRSVKGINAAVRPQQTQEAPLFTQDIPTNTIEAKHKTNSDSAYAKICSTWQRLQGDLGLVNITDVQWNRQTDQIDEEVNEFQDITKVRKEALKTATRELVEQYELYDLILQVKDRNEFWDYKVPSGQLVLNFSWDILMHFKPAFAAKILCIIQSLCVIPSILQSLAGWENFKANEWQKYGFIDEILKDYQQEWQTNPASQMHFI